jgi:hypothetical protein
MKALSLEHPVRRITIRSGDGGADMSIVNIVAGLAFIALAPSVDGGADHSQMAAASHAASATCHRRVTTANMKDIRISGILVLRMTYGPPNYGENPKTDSRFAYWVVKLDYPIAVITGIDIGMPSQMVTAREMQIRRRPGLVDVGPFRGKHVIVQGVVGTQEFAEDMTPVIIDASSMVAGGPIPCKG